MLRKLRKPPRFLFLRKFIKVDNSVVLDFGCGNVSPSLTKRWYPNCSYYGADIYKPEDDQMACMRDFFLVDKFEARGYKEIPDRFFDLILVNHVIEHVTDIATLVASLSRKLRSGGVILFVFPTPRSVNFPSGKGTLNFFDDPDHVSKIEIPTLVDLLLDNNLEILSKGVLSDWVRYLVGALIMPLALCTRLVAGRYLVRGLWQFYGFEEYVMGRQRDS